MIISSQGQKVMNNESSKSLTFSRWVSVYVNDDGDCPVFVKKKKTQKTLVGRHWFLKSACDLIKHATYTEVTVKVHVE